MQLANGFSNKASQFTLSKGGEVTPHVSAEMTPHTLAELLKEKIPPKIVGETPVSQPYEAYLNALNDYARASQTVGKARQALATIELEGGKGPAKVLAELQKALAHVDLNTMSKFESESRAAAKSISRTKYRLQQAPQSYFNDFRDRKDTFESFARARAIQRREDIPKVPVGSGFSTVEEVIHALPPNLDLTQELYRYSLIKDFEQVLLEDIKPNAKEILQTTAQQQIKTFLSTPSHLETDIKSYISTLGEDDYARFFNVPLASVHTKLAQIPTSEQKILYALDNYKSLLQKTDYENLRKASGTRRTLQRALDLIKKPQGGQEPKLDSYIKTLEAFEAQALDKSSINYPYLDELFRTHMIDPATYSQLSSPGMTRAQFLDVLGTREKFTPKLMDQFRKTLEAESLEEVANDQLLDIASAHLTRSYFEQLDTRAKQFYLTTDAFTKPQSLKFDQAIGVYDKSSLRKFLSVPPHRDLLTKAWVEAHLNQASPVDKLEAFLNEVHLTGRFQPNPEVDHPILAYIPGLDSRLLEFVEKPLVENDARLIGTRYAHMSDDARKSLNGAAFTVFGDYHKLNEAAKSNPKLVKQIEKLEAQLNEDIPPMLEVMDFIYSHKNSLNIGGG